MNKLGRHLSIETIICDLEKIRANTDDSQAITSIRIAAQAVLFALSRDQLKAFERFIAGLDSGLSKEQEQSLSLHWLKPRADPKRIEEQR